MWWRLVLLACAQSAVVRLPLRKHTAQRGRRARRRVIERARHRRRATTAAVPVEPCGDAVYYGKSPGL